ncbi:hypothetical protein D3C75_1092640 [compost metagenome]
MGHHFIGNFRRLPVFIHFIRRALQPLYIHDPGPVQLLVAIQQGKEPGRLLDCKIISTRVGEY